MDEPRAQAADEIRDDFLDACRAIVTYWAGQRGDCGDRISGALHSFLCIIDGVSNGMPAFDLVARPHPDDKEYDRSEGDNWIEPGTVINASSSLHEMLYPGREA